MQLSLKAFGIKIFAIRVPTFRCFVVEREFFSWQTLEEYKLLNLKLVLNHLN